LHVDPRLSSADKSQCFLVYPCLSQYISKHFGSRYKTHFWDTCVYPQIFMTTLHHVQN
jgi:hypothetical protein